MEFKYLHHCTIDVYMAEYRNQFWLIYSHFLLNSLWLILIFQQRCSFLFQVNCDIFYFIQFKYIYKSSSRSYQLFLNISRNSWVALLKLGNQLEGTLLHMHEQTLLWGYSVSCDMPLSCDHCLFSWSTSIQRNYWKAFEDDSMNDENISSFTYT